MPPAIWLGRYLRFYEQIGPVLFVLIAAPLVTLHSSLQHEALHGHPTRSAALNEALVFPPLGLLFPIAASRRCICAITTTRR